MFEASNQLKKTCDRYRNREFICQQQLWELVWERGELGDFALEEVASKEDGSEIWQEAVCINIRHI